MYRIYIHNDTYDVVYNYLIKNIETKFLLIAFPNKYYIIPVVFLLIFLVNRHYSVSRVENVMTKFNSLTSSQKDVWKFLTVIFFVGPIVVIAFLLKKQDVRQRTTWVLLQVWLDVVIFGCSSLSAAVSADGILLGFQLLSCTFKSLLGSSSGQDKQ